MTISEELEERAKKEKRVTNKRIRDRFDVDEETAGDYYDYLRCAGIVGSMGYVEKGGAK